MVLGLELVGVLVVVLVVALWGRSTSNLSTKLLSHLATSLIKSLSHLATSLIKSLSHLATSLIKLLSHLVTSLTKLLSH